MPEGWEWDETLYRGSAAYYARGRLPYANGLADVLAERLELDGSGRLIDIGCGPGTIALLLAHLFKEVTGVDPDAEMLAEAARQAHANGIGNTTWVRARAEEIPADSGTFNVATFAQSFHWTDRLRVARRVFKFLESGGVLVHINDSKNYLRTPRIEDARYPSPPYEAIGELVKRYLGPVRRAGQGTLPFGTPGGQGDVLVDAGFIASDQLNVPGAGETERMVEEVIAWVYSRSDSAPHLFGNDLDEFEVELRELLVAVSPAGLFSETFPDTEVEIFQKP